MLTFFKKEKRAGFSPCWVMDIDPTEADVAGELPTRLISQKSAVIWRNGASRKERKNRSTGNESILIRLQSSRVFFNDDYISFQEGIS